MQHYCQICHLHTTEAVRFQQIVLNRELNFNHSSTVEKSRSEGSCVSCNCSAWVSAGSINENGTVLPPCGESLSLGAVGVAFGH